MARPTRTLNPLPFVDLEPHRFEDLVRQLAYEFREWASLEAIGRGGADLGTDILGQEVVRPRGVSSEETGEAEDASSAPTTRPWIFQCKREARFGPTDVASAVNASVPDGSSPPHGFVLATSAHVSRKARDVFRSLMVERDVAESYLWAQGELEDMLFQAQNDRLLFAYFGISLVQRRQTTGRRIRSTVALKREIQRWFDKLEEDGPARDELFVAIRDADRPSTAPSEAPVLLRQILKLFTEVGLVVRDTEHDAYLEPGGRAWDALEQVNQVEVRARRHVDELIAGPRGRRPDEPRDHELVERFFRVHVDHDARARLERNRIIPYDRIVALDPIGTALHPLPHLHVDFAATGDPYDPQFRRQWIGRYNDESSWREAEESDRIRIFPAELPPDPLTVPWLTPSVDGRAAKLGPASLQRLAAVLDPAPDGEEEDAARRPAPELADRALASRWLSTVAVPVLLGFRRALERGGIRSRVVRNDAASAPNVRLITWRWKEQMWRGGPDLAEEFVTVELVELGNAWGARVTSSYGADFRVPVHPIGQLDANRLEELVGGTLAERLGT